jgi:hypothetical protein
MGRIALFTFAGLSAVPASAQNNALDFDGVDDIASVAGASALIAGASGLSITCWVYPRNVTPAFPDLDGIVGFRNDIDGDFYLLHIDPANGVEGAFTNSAGTTFTISAPALIVNQWQHLALVYDGAFLTLYRNGVALANTPASGIITNPTIPLLIGDLYSAGNHFFLDGRLDEVTVWTRALTEPELECILTSGLDPVDADLQFYYKCDQGTPGGNNTGIFLLNDEQGHIDAALTGFSLLSNTSNFVNGVPVGTTLNESICQGETYLLGGQLLSYPGTYTENFLTGGSCDSIVTVILEVIPVNTAVAVDWSTLIATPAATAWQWLDCVNAFAPVPGAVASTFTATSDGSYAVEVTQNGCTDTSDCVTIVNAGFSDGAGPMAFLRYDRGADVLVVHGHAGAELAVVDIIGRTVWTSRVIGPNERVPVPALPEGPYTAVVRGGRRPDHLCFVR